MQAQSLGEVPASQDAGWEGPLEKEIANHSNILAWEIPRTEETGELQFMESQRESAHNLATKQQQSN